MACIKASVVCSLLSLKERQKQIQYFRDGSTKILLATESFSRALDVRDCKIVVNVHLGHAADNDKACMKSYLYRVSRAGRLCSNAIAITLVDDERSQNLFRQISTYYRFHLNEFTIQP